MKINEKQLKNIISGVIRESMEEMGFIDKIQDRINNFTPKDREYSTDDSIETVAEQNGWEVNTFVRRGGKNHYELVQKTSMFGYAKNGVLSPKELVNDINIHLNGKGRVVNAKAGYIGGEDTASKGIAKTLSFDIQYNN